MTWSGADVSDEPERTSVGGVPVEALDHRFEPVSVRSLFYKASTTNPDRTVHRWRSTLMDITVIDVDGRHRGFDSIMEPPRVSQIADDLARRLPS